ncbi:MAG: hypothetical protein LBC82_01755 [Oscillospiraceae bacterium]|jgi:hypothetical protein|nr:hypothetical protein [Oscillospiraceae bacterium]
MATDTIEKTAQETPENLENEAFCLFSEAVKSFGLTKENIEPENIVRYEPNKYIVYIDNRGEARYSSMRSPAEQNKERHAKLFGEASFIRRKPVIDMLKPNLKKHFTAMLAKSYSYILEEEYNVAEEYIKKISEFLDNRNKEIARKWHIVFSGILVVVFFALFAGVTYCFKANDNALFVQFSQFMPVGALGAAISIFQNTKNKEYNCESGKFLNFLEIFVRIITGIVAAFLAICVYNIDRAGTTSSETLIITCFAVGFSERFIPSIVKKFESTP